MSEYNADEEVVVTGVRIVLDDTAQLAHYVHWQGEGWYCGRVVGESGKYMRWTYATPEVRREYPCQYLHQAGSVLLLMYVSQSQEGEES